MDNPVDKGQATEFRCGLMVRFMKVHGNLIVPMETVDLFEPMETHMLMKIKILGW